MGQGCSSNVADAIAEAHGQETGPSSTAAQLGNGNSKSSTAWRQQNARRIEELVINLSRDEFRALLELFRAKCRLERSLLHTSTTSVLTNGNKAAPAPAINLAWKRIALTEEALFSLFPSVSALNFAQILSCLRAAVTQQRQLHSSDEPIAAEHRERGKENSENLHQISELPLPTITIRLVSKVQLMRAFHCSTYLYHPRDQHLLTADASESYIANPLERSNSIAPALTSASSVTALGASSRALSTASMQSTGTAAVSGSAAAPVAATTVHAVVQHKELLFRDFCFALSLCRHGSVAEQLTFLFVLFADPAAQQSTSISAGNTDVAPSAAPSRANSTKFPSSAQIYVVPQGADASSAGTVDRNAAGQTVPTAGITSNTVSTADDAGGNATVESGESFPARQDSPCPQEETIPSTATNDVNIELAGGPNQMPAASNGITIKPAPAPLTSQPSSAALPPPMKSRMFSFSATPKPVVIEKTQLQQLELSEAGALKMWLFLQLQLLRVTFPALSLALSSLVFNSGNNCDIRAVYDVFQTILSVHWVDSQALAAAPVEQILQYAERLVTLQQSLSADTVNNSNSINTNKTVMSYADFIQLCRGDKVAGPGDTDASSGTVRNSAVVKESSIFALLRNTGALCGDNVRSALQEFASDVLPSQMQVQQLGATYFSASQAQTDLQKCLSLLHTDQLIPPAVRSNFAVFALDARWFIEWCHSAKVEPVFYTPTAVPATTAPATAASTLSLSGLRSSPSKTKRRGKSKTKQVPTTECIKHLVVNLRPCVRNDGGNKLPELRNSCLLNKDGVGVLRLRSTDQLVPFVPTTSALPGDKHQQDQQPDAHTYVLLPYELGRQLYLRFDPQASVVDATTYRRYLRFASNAQPIEPSSDLSDAGEVDRDQLQALGPTATQLIHNFNATLEAQCDPHPVVIPLYLCTPAGVATVAPVDTLHISVRPPTVAGAPPVCVLSSVHNMFPRGADLSERAVTAVSLKDLVHTAMCALDVTQSPTEDILQTYRVWGLYPSSQDNARTAPGIPTVQHSTTTVWRLLTAASAQYETRLSDILTPPPVPSAKNSQGKPTKVSKVSTAAAVCMGFMLEKSVVNTSTTAATASAQQRGWPTDRILAAQGNIRRTSETSSETCPFKIAERVDMLTDTNKWVVGVVTNIAREQSLTSDAVTVKVTVRQLLDGDAPGTQQLLPLEKPADSTTTTGLQGETMDAPQSISDDGTSTGVPRQPAVSETVPATSGSTNAVVAAPVPAAPVPQPAQAAFKRPKASTDAPELATEPHLNPENELNGEESDREGENDDQDVGLGDNDGDGSDAESAVGDVRRPVNPALQEAINKNNALEAKRAALAAEAESLEDSQEEGSEDGSYEDESSTASPAPTKKSAAATAADAAQAAQLSAEEVARIEAEALRAANTHSGVTWDSAVTKQSRAKSDLLITVSHTSLRILNLGTMTSPLLASKAPSKGSNSSVSSLQYTELLLHLKKHMQDVAVAHRCARDYPSSNDSLTRVGSALTSTNDLSRQGSSLSIVKKAPGSSSSPTHRASFFGTRSSVIPISQDDPRYEHNGEAAGLKSVGSVDSFHSGPDAPADLSRAGSLLGSVDHQAQLQAQAQEQGLSTLEWRHLVMCAKNANTCPFRLRALYLLVLSDRLLALEQGHPHRGTVVLQNRVYDADFYVTPLPATTLALDAPVSDPSETATQSSQSAEDRPHTERQTLNAANVVQTRPKQRNAFEKFLKSCSKSLQHGLIPRPNQAVPAEDVAVELGDIVNNDTSNSTSGGDGNGDTNPAEPTGGSTADSAASIANSFSVKGEHRRSVDHHQASIGTGTISRVPTLAQPPVSAFPHQVYGHRRGSVASSGTRGHEKNNANSVRLLGVAGLNNLGNTCFMSASLQCLFRTTPLVSYFLSHQYRYDINARSNLGSKGKLTEEFAKFLQTIYTMTPIPVSSLKLRKAIVAATKSSSAHRPNNANNTQGSQLNTTGTIAAAPHRNLLFSNLSPTTLLKAFQAHKPQFSGADQQDSQEFLCELLDTFHEDLKLPPALSKPTAVAVSVEGSVVGNGADASGIAGEGASSAAQESAAGSVTGGSAVSSTTTPAAASGPTAELSVQAQGEQRWAKYLETNSSIVTNLFQGQMCSKIVCKVCNTSSANFEPFTTLSMPIPRLRSNSVSSPGDLTTVIVTVYRKMPRLSQILRLPDECFEGGVLTQEQLLELYRANRNPVKLALQFPRYATVENVLTKAVQLYNAYEADAASNADHNSSAFNSAAGTPITRTAGTVNGGARSFADDQSAAGNSYQNLDSTAQSLSGDNNANGVPNSDGNGPSAGVTAASAVVDITVAAGVYAADAVAGTANTDTLTALTAPEQGESGTVASNSSAQSPTSRSPSQAPPLLMANAIVIDINDKRKGRFGKMLDKRDTLQPLVDESTGECQLILQERCKDITFVASLQASRLSMEYEHRVKHGHRQQSTYFTTLLDYFDSSEYDVGHYLYNNYPTLEGRLLADFDHVYNPQTYPGRSDHSVDSMSTFLRADEIAPAGAGASAGASATASAATSKAGSAKAAKVDAAKVANAQLASRVPDYSFRNAKPWPVSLFDFQVGDRVDAVDYKGTWYPGSVIDLLVLSERDIKSHALTRYCRDFIRKDGGIQGASNSREACTAGLHVKVHFDGFKCTWDEWYDQRDFERGFLAPVYTKTSRKLKMHEIPIIQRRLVYTTQGYDNDEQDSPQPSPPPTTGTHRSRRTGTAGTATTTGISGTNTTGTAGVPATPNAGAGAAGGLQSGMASLNIEILDCPSFVQGESYRSCAHLYHHVYEQMLRYVDEDLLLQTVERPVGDENSPFTIRLLSFDNLLMAPIDHHCPVVTTVTRNADGSTEGAGEARSEVIISNTSPGVEFSVADRFNGHKNWEGCAMPMDIARPIVNIYHNKLAIAVDWFVHVDLPPLAVNTVNTMGGAGQRAGEALIVDTSTPITSSIAAGLLHEAMLYRHDASYQHYLAAQRQRLHAAQVAAARQREQQHRDELQRQEAALVNASSNNGAGGAGAGLSAEDALLLAYKNDMRNGLTIEDVLSKFVHSEDIEEYYCNHCRKPTPGKLHSSIHTLPDVLILHLQRLVITSNGGGKIRTLVKFPLVQLNMRPFTTEQKEYVAGLAELAADTVYGGNPAGNNASSSTDSSNADIYELYGVVNHIGGMNGGHYTALSKCEEVVLQDLATERYQRTTDPTACTTASATAVAPTALYASTNSTGASCGGAPAQVDCVGDSVGDAPPASTHSHAVAPLSMSEFITSTLVHQTGVSGGFAEAGVVSSAAGAGGKTKWLKFDDEFVNVVPAANLHNSVVTESAFLLFYQRKQLSDQNLARYI